MLLHGQPGSGKTFFIERIRDYTNIRMKISASSGIAGMSLGGTTLDWLMGFGYGSKSTVDLETLRKRFKGTELLIIDEISMIGCKKLLRVDNILKKVFNDTKPFGGASQSVSQSVSQLASQPSNSRQANQVSQSKQASQQARQANIASQAKMPSHGK